MRYRKTSNVTIDREDLLRLLALKGVEMPKIGPGPDAGINIRVTAKIHSHDQVGELVSLEVEATWTTEASK